MGSPTTNDLKHNLILNRLIKNKSYRTYVEIGVQYKANWDTIECAHMVGVEPVGDLNDDRIIKVSSDEFFRTNDKFFDLIFIDGDHTAAAVSRDLTNAAKWLAEGGTIVLHDAYPPDERHTTPYLCGTVYEAVWHFRRHGGFKILTYAGDFGVCLLKRDHAMLPTVHAVSDYHTYVTHADEIINLKRIDEEFLAALDAF